MTSIGRVEMCRVLDEDPDLAEAIPEPRRSAAVDACVAPVIRIDTGPWTPPRSLGPDVLGLLVLDGILIRKIAVGSRFAVVVFGAGDLVRPWQPSAASGSREPPQWIAYSPVRCAALNATFTRQFASFPELAGGLVQRVIDHNRELSVNMAIASHTRVDARLYMIMWQMAGRWGRMRPDGVLLPLKLTHQLLGDLVAARRPTVTTALSELTHRDLIEQLDEGWLLKGDPPIDVLEV